MAGPFYLRHAAARRLAREAVDAAPDGHVVVIREPSRTLDQNALLHSLIGEITKAMPAWNGINMDAEDWKALLIVSHAVATKDGSPYRMVPDLEGSGFVQLRESSARMNKDRASSLIEYVTAWATSHGIQLRETT